MARTLSMLIILLWGYFIVAHLFGSAGQSSRPLTASDYVQFSMVLLWLVGLAIAWRWELAGAVVTLTAAMVAGLINPKAVTGWGMLPAVTAMLFLFCWWVSRASRHENRPA